MQTQLLPRPLGRVHMPKSTDISLASYFNRPSFGASFREHEPRIPDAFGPRQTLDGFESTYHNIIDYIVRITHRIWEDRDVEYIADTYSSESNVFDDYGLQLGNKKIIQDTYHTTGAFSDIQLIADEVIWAGDSDLGYRTSHRTLIRGTNDGDSKYGPATGKTVDVLVIANCVAKGNVIFLEHVLYNNSSLIQQLGFDLNETVRKMVAGSPPGWPRDADTWKLLRNTGSVDVPLCLAEPLTGFDVDQLERNLFDRIWNRKEFDACAEFYAEDFPFRGATDRSFVGADAYLAFVSELWASFPDLQVQLDDVYWMGNEDEGFLASVRWSADATHTGAGVFGPPTGKQVQIWGLTQHFIKNGRVLREWTLFNELDLMMQIEMAKQ